MTKTRVIPVLLLKGKGLYKTTRFKAPKYIGDPLNSVRIFNEKEVDELAFLDISATEERRGPDFDLLEDIAGEAFMPMAYGGGIATIEDVRRIFKIGFEKVIINTAAYRNPALIGEAVGIFGAQSVVGCVDVTKGLFGGYRLKNQKVALKEHLAELIRRGVGEILVNNVDRDGTMAGYDLELVKSVTGAVSVPVIACGGASGMDDFVAAANEAGASAVSAGALFVYVGTHRAVLINYPDRREIEQRLP